jgi:hypothetical protein
MSQRENRCAMQLSARINPICPKSEGSRPESSGPNANESLPRKIKRSYGDTWLTYLLININMFSVTILKYSHGLLFHNTFNISIADENVASLASQTENDWDTAALQEADVVALLSSRMCPRDISIVRSHEPHSVYSTVERV